MFNDDTKILVCFAALLLLSSISFLSLDLIELASFISFCFYAGRKSRKFFFSPVASGGIELHDGVDSYMKSVFSDVVPLGSIKELPAETCGEIEASEGNQMADGKYWIYSEQNSEVIKAYCKGKLFN